MAIRNVESTLADKDYIKALERELAELRQLAQQAMQIAISAQRGR